MVGPPMSALRGACASAHQFTWSAQREQPLMSANRSRLDVAAPASADAVQNRPRTVNGDGGHPLTATQHASCTGQTRPDHPFGGGADSQANWQEIPSYRRLRVRSPRPPVSLSVMQGPGTRTLPGDRILLRSGDLNRIAVLGAWPSAGVRPAGWSRGRRPCRPASSCPGPGPDRDTRGDAGEIPESRAGDPLACPAVRASLRSAPRAAPRPGRRPVRAASARRRRVR